QLVDVVGDKLAVALRLAANADDVTADEFADLAFYFHLRQRIDLGGFTRLEKAHDGYPRSAPHPCGQNSTGYFPHENVTTSRPNKIRAVAFARSCRTGKRLRPPRTLSRGPGIAAYLVAAFILS